MTSCHRATTDMCSILILVVISSFVSHTDAALSVSVSPSFVARYPTQTVTFSCTVSDNQYTVTSVRWYFSNTLILSDGSAISSYVGRASGGTTNSPSLTLTNLVMSDAGSYICSASNSNGENKNSSHSTLGMQNGVTPSNVQIANVVGNTISLIAGDSIILNCSASGSPTPTITFWRNGVKIWDGSPYTLTNVQSGQAGQYMCIASNFFGQSNNTVQVDVYVKPSTVSLSVTSTNVNVNQAVTFSCSANGIPSQSYRWYKGNSLIPGQTSSTYQIASVQGTDSGSYQCQAYNLAGSTTSSTVTFTVNTAAGPGTITFSQSSPLTVLKGNQLSITCSASGNPLPTYSWSKGGTTIFNGGTLLLSNAAKTDSGVYTCTGTNSEGTNSGQFTVNVQYAPEMTTTSNSVSATDGETISLTCNNDANPEATTFEWSCQGSTSNTTKTLSVSVSGTDDFTCSCKAFNSIGASGSQTFSVTVSASGGTGNLGAATGDGGLTTGEIAAICLAVLFVVLLIIIIIVCCCLYGICAGVCGKKEKHKVEPEAEKEKEVIHHVEIPRFHEEPKKRVPSAVTRKDVNLTVNQDNMMYEQEEEFEINTKYAIVPPGSHRSVNGTIITLQDQPAPRDHRLPALDLTYDEEERRRKRRRRKKKKHHSHREPAEGMETPHEPRESSRSRRSHRSHRSSHRYSGELMDSDNYHSRYEDGDLVVIPGPDGYDQ